MLVGLLIRGACLILPRAPRRNEQPLEEILSREQAPGRCSYLWSRDYNPECASALEEYFGEHGARKEISLDERLLILEALGNLGAQETSSFVIDACDDESDSVRTAAIHAVLRTFDEKANDVVLEAIRSDPAESVRIAAARALLQAERPQGQEALREALLSDPSEEVRSTILQAWSRAIITERTTQELVAWIAENDPSPKLREHAKRLLENPSLSP